MAWMKKKMGCKASNAADRFFFATPYPSRPVSATYFTNSTVLLIFNFRKILAL